MESLGPTFLLDSTYVPTITEKGTILNLSLQSDISMKSKDKYVLIVLDISGSMSGSKIQTSKDAIAEVVKMLFAHNQQPKVDLIAFNSRPTFHSLQNKSLDECLKVISEIRAGGGTCFIPVFNMIQDLVSPQPKQSIMGQVADKVKGLFSNSTEQTAATTTAPKVDELAVIFLSDGEGESLDQLQPHIKSLKAVAEEKLSSAEFHTLGFGADHDARLLEEMTKAMPTQGTFQYVKESREIQPCIENISGCLVEKRLTAFVSWGEKNEKKVNFISQFDKSKAQGMQSYWEAIVCLQQPIDEFEKIKNCLKLHIKLEDAFKVLDIATVFKKAEGKAIEIRQNCAFINEELKKISDAIIGGGSFDATKAEQHRDQVAGLRVMLNELTKDIFKLKIDERKMAIEVTKDLNDYMDKIGELLRASANQGLTNDQIASINALAYRQVTKKSNLKTLDKRALQNVELLNKVAIKAQEVSEKIDEKEFTEKYSTLIKEIGCCALNLSNLPEALKGQDCLCITFDIGRPEVAIQDASRIIVKKIYPTIICASAFLDSVKYSMKLNPNNSGGFDTSYQGDIVKGASNESITAALPLYFCPEHWESASEYIKPILGWDVTIDPLGYDYNQLRTVPFLLLIKALNEKQANPNEFNTRVAKWLLETCCQIIRDEMKTNPQANLAENIKGIWEKYDVDGTVRGVESVQNNNILLAYVYCLQDMGVLKSDDKESFMKKIRYMVEEDMRRRQEKGKTWTGSQVRKNIKKIMNLDVDSYVELFVQEDQQNEKKTSEETKKEEEPKAKTTESVEEKDKRLHEIYKKATESQKKKTKIDNKREREARNKDKADKNKEKKEEKKTDFNLTVPKEFLDRLVAHNFKIDSIFPATFESLDKTQKEHATQAFQSFKASTRFLKSWVKIFNFDENLEKVEAIGITNPLQLFALHIQNKIHHKNSDRLESFQTKTYSDPFDAETARNYITKLSGQVIYDKYNKELNSKPKDMSNTVEDLKFFAETENLEAAAGLLVKGFNLGSFEHLQNILRKDAVLCKKVLEKMLMISHKEYKGVSFDLDFRLKKKYARQLYKRYQDKYTYQEWKEIWFR